METRPSPSWRAVVQRRASLAGEILVAYLVTRWQISRDDVRGVVASTRRLPPRRASSQNLSPTEVWLLGARLGRTVDRMLTLLPTDSRCLAQALVLSRLLAARGITSTLVIGARAEPAFKAHAWVEYQGKAVLPVLGFGESRLLEL